MNARTLRRAIERKQTRQTQKAQARQEAATLLATAVETFDAEYEATKASLLQLQANRRNAQSSTGPKTEAGKAIASRNALKTGLTGRTILLASEDDAILYEHHVQSLVAELHPVGARETGLTQSIADTQWRVARIPSLEYGLYALGRGEFAEEFQTHPEAEAAILIEAKTFLAYQRQLKNLNLQESRLRRQAEKDTAELKRLQELRTASVASPNCQSATPQPQIGFEFSNPAPDILESDLTLDCGLLTRLQAA